MSVEQVVAVRPPIHESFDLGPGALARGVEKELGSDNEADLVITLGIVAYNYLRHNSKPVVINGTSRATLSKITQHMEDEFVYYESGFRSGVEMLEDAKRIKELVISTSLPKDSGILARINVIGKNAFGSEDVTTNKEFLEAAILAKRMEISGGTNIKRDGKATGEERKTLHLSSDVSRTDSIRNHYLILQGIALAAFENGNFEQGMSAAYEGTDGLLQKGTRLHAVISKMAEEDRLKVATYFKIRSDESVLNSRASQF